ncbi:MAG TPA: hypothetical protein VK551_03335 [Thermodesulfobacteriota bacterium]|jgi:isocitrate dehydrogenase|nr:hypothetical protein [Thermodesulfobacteriota bacterium]
MAGDKEEWTFRLDEHDLARQMRGAKRVRCSEFAFGIIENL